MMHLRYRHIAPLSVVVSLAACQGESPRSGGDTSAPPADSLTELDTSTADTPSVDADDPPLRTEPFHVIAPGRVVGGMLTTAAECATCHTTEATSLAMRDAAGRDVSPYNLWQGSMKANSARDPFFRATLSVERARFPDFTGAVDVKCLSCHAPLGTADATAAASTLAVTDLATADRRGLLAADGVSCTSCHGQEPTTLGTEGTWSGALDLNDQDLMYGPHASPFSNPMRNHVALTPAYGGHVLDATMCVSCHTLITHALDVEDAPDFPEQTPYLEWLNSTYADRADPITCQDCHMPTSDADGLPIETRIARRPPGGDFPSVLPRTPYGRHLFIGGNTLIPEILKRFRADLLPAAPDAAFDATVAFARDQLAHRTTRVTLDGLAWDGSRLTGTVKVENLTGHKFPSGYPSRRAWLHLEVLDASGATLFEAGAHDADGRVLGTDGLPLPSEAVGGSFAAHRSVIATPADVVLWEAIQGDKDDQPVIALLRAVRYLKDTRLLPAGWRADGAYAERTAPVGTSGDTDFIAGSDTVAFDLPLGAAPAEVVATVRYQVLGARWAAELFAAETPDVRAFEAMVKDVGLTTEAAGEARHSF